MPNTVAVDCFEYMKSMQQLYLKYSIQMLQ